MAEATDMYSAPRATRLRRGQAASEFDRRGFLIVPEVLSPGQLAATRDEATAICRGGRGAIEGVVAAGDEDSDADVLRRYLCVHFPHKISPRLRVIGRQPAIVDILTEVIGPDVKMMQSMLFLKAGGQPGQAWHQDEAHIPTRDRSLTAVWLALDDATIANGCLWAIPGSHRPGILHPVRQHHDRRFDATPEAYGFDQAHDAVPLELAAGGAVVFDGYLLHRSLPNTRPDGLRRALVNHYMSAQSLLPWCPPDDGQAMGTLDHRDILLVAGRDPYEANGITDVLQPHLR